MGQRISISAWPSGATGAQDAVAPAPQAQPPAMAAYKIDKVAVPETPPVVAVITAVPTASALASPFGSTLAMSGCAEAHVKACPGTGFPFASCATAVNCCVSPSASSVAVAGLTTTEPTACTTDSTAVPDTPAIVAEIVATPFATAVARPVTGSMATTPAGDADQANVPPGTPFPFA